MNERIKNVLAAKHIEPTDERALDVVYKTARKDALRECLGLLKTALKTKTIPEIIRTIEKKIKEV